ncbi:MAG: D-aminoacyl-tRNA deacylase [Bacilli bacterium]|nr:D-aminoacyl-tRNA deacylase [Bacilli bacterium]
MKVLVQRVLSSSVEVDNKIVGQINKGLMLLVGFTDSDTDKEIDYMVDKIINLRIFDDENGVMNKSLIDVNGSILSISQFTLYADTRKGRRPSYIKALNGDKAILLYDKFNNKLKKENIKVETGIFGADMKVFLINDGPITIMLEK